MLQALYRERVIWLTRVCQVSWGSGKAPKDGQTGVIIPTQEGRQEKTHQLQGHLSLASLKKCMSTAFKIDAAK